MVLVQRTIDSRYKPDTAAFRTLLNSPITRAYTVAPGDSLQKIVSSHFSVGPTQARRLYENIAAQIQLLNELPTPEKIVVGKSLILPDIPPLQWKTPSASNPNHGVPRIQVAPPLISQAAKTIARVSDIGRRTEALVSQWRWLTVEQARVEAQQSSDASSNLDFWTQPMTIKFAQGAAPAALAAPGPSGAMRGDTIFLKALIKRLPVPRDVVVFVLDDSWPSDAAFETSRAFLVKELDHIADVNQLSRPNWPAAFRAGSAKTDFPLKSPGRHSHAALIETALAPFTALTPRVHVVYLPLFTEQKWASETWTVLATATMDAKSMRGALGTRPVEPEMTAASLKSATELVKVIPVKAVDDVDNAQQGPLTVMTRFAQLYANTESVPFFVSMSWTVAKTQLDYYPDPDLMGVSLAAAGNDSKDVLHNFVYMAYRAKDSPGDFFAVMNTDGSGGEWCNTNELPFNDDTPFYGLAYDGTIEGPEPACATSFSTPRAAWLLALRQAYYSPVAGDEERRGWFGAYRKSLLSLQTSTLKSSKRYLLNVPKLFNGL